MASAAAGARSSAHCDAAPPRAAPHEGAIAYSERIAHERPDLASTLRPLARHYARLRYGAGGSAAQLQRFRRAVRFFIARLRRR